MSLANLPFALDVTLERALRQAYTTPPRAYHNFAHVEEVLAQYASVPAWRDPVSVALAILFHDAIYVAGRSDNEAESARLARALLGPSILNARLDLAMIEELILLTARHGSLDATALPLDTRHFLDCDMAILGAARPRFDAYEHAIAQEYGHVPRAAYCEGRGRFLSKLLERPIYLSESFRLRYEQSARENITRALAKLALG